MKKLLVASSYPLRFGTYSSYKLIREVVTTSRISFCPDEYNFALRSEKISELKKETNSFEECCERKIKYFEDLRKPMFLLWSGGIDSTAVLVSFLKFGSVELRKRTTILLNVYSLREYSEMFHLISQNFKIESSFNPLTNFIKDGILVTGELGDQLFGSDLIFDLVSLLGEESLTRPYEDELKNLFSYRGGEDEGKAFFERYQKIVSESPIEIKTAFDFLWWWNFSQKWQHVKYRFLLSDNWPDIASAVENVQHFYDSHSFQNWSIQNQDKKIGKKLSSYKQIVKDFIVETTKHQFYRSKMKMGSLGYIWFGKKAHFAVDEDFNYVSPERHLEFRKGTF